ncbi:PKD domain-containing protein [Paenibacillus hemerocallicola]|uniref:PKD domain-containing protein n=1 Tax=Paenibacillus hemerocallicola TaxID=1172614 RepID=UPI00159ED8BC|nr:PKD domain-containing protein [Paenibacillus hemerocallicola]
MEKEFVTADRLAVLTDVVNRSNATVTAEVIDGEDVPGPDNEDLDGSVDSSTITINANPGGLTPDNRIVVRFTQSFMQASPYAKPLPAYGASLMVYYNAFTVDVEAVTYQYPYTLEVEYEPAAKPDLLPDGITTTGSVKLDELKTYTIKFKNLGTPITNTPFRVIVKHISSGGTVFDKHFSSINKDQVLTDTFTYTAISPQKLRFGLYVDYGTGKGAIDEGDSGGELNNYAEYEFPVNIGIDGDFDLVPSTIRYTDNFQAVPKNFEIPSSCTYRYHQYRFIQNGVTWTTNNINGRTTTTSFLYPSYPDNLSIGTSMVALQIYTSCGDTGWINEKPLVIQPSDKPNTPPEFRAGFFLENNRTGTDPVSTVILGSHVNLRIIDDPSSTPPSPYDEEKDYPITWNWDFAGSTTSWIQGLSAQYGFDRREDHFYNIKADELGNFSIRVTGTDRRGEATSRMVFLNVIPPNPIAWCSAPSPVKANRPVDQSKFLSTYSYSPSGSTINHSRDEWVNKQTSYSNLTDSDLTAMVQLWVYDSGGLKSLAPANCPIVVKPDQPPVGKVDVPPLGLRGHTYELFNKSYSPDSDVLTSASYRFKYDAANNGFEDDGWQWLGGTMEKASFSPNRVGKYLFDVTVCEEYGKCADASATQTVSLLVLDTINLAPTVSFDIFGKNQQPDVDVPSTFSAQMMMSWPLYDVNTNTQLPKRLHSWSIQNGALASGLGKGMERKYDVSSQYYHGNGQTTYRPYFNYYSDNGFGANRITPYKGIDTVDTTTMQPVLVPSTVGGVTSLTPAKYGNIVQTNRTHLIFDTVSSDGTSTGLYGYNLSKMPKYAATTVSVPPFETYLKHTWPNGDDPYDYILNANGDYTSISYQVPVYADYTTLQANIANINNGNYTGAKGFTTYTYSYSTFMGFGVAGENIYKFLGGGNKYKAAYEYFDYYDEESGSGCDCMVAAPYWGSDLPAEQMARILVYDSYTGALKVTTNNADVAGTNRVPFLETGKQSKYFTLFDKGENLVMLSVRDTYSYGGNYQIEQIEIDPQGNTVRKNTLTFPASMDGAASCTFDRPTGLYRGLDGEYFSFIFNKCKTPSATNFYNKDYYAFKVDGNLNLAWMTKLNGTGFYRDPDTIFSTNWEAKQVAAFNPVTNQLITRSYTFSYCSTGCTSPTVNNYQELLDGATGALSWWPGTPISNMGSGFNILSNGGYGPLNSAPDTITGDAGTYRNWGSGTYLVNRKDLGFSDEEKTSTLVSGEYVADGVFLGIFQVYKQTVTGGGGQGFDSPDRALYLARGTPRQDVTRNGFQLGQFMSGTSYDNTELTYTMTMRHPNIDTGLAGFSFRMQDPTNRYAVEADASTLYISRYIGGSRAVLASIPYPFQPSADYVFKVSMSGNQIAVTLNGVPYLSATDGTFASGKLGPFTTKSYVSFKGVGMQSVPTQNIEWMTQYAIWEDGEARAEARYENIAFTDPENDPMSGAFRWMMYHSPKFFNNQGVSGMHGQSFTGPQQYFDKVGLYTIQLQARDDPHPEHPYPSGIFDSYRKDSNTFAKRLIVHRRPVAVMSAWVNGDGTIGYSDGSYDPDRWINASNYSPPDSTGIDYGATRGIMERKYYSISPSGQYSESKMTRPTETGTYTLGLMVRDEYGAWSYPVTTTVNVGVIPPGNNRPTATLTYPNGSQASPNLIHTSVPTITWDQLDTAGTIFQGYHVKIADESGAIVLETGERTQWTLSNSASWPVPTALPVGKKYQVQVRVSDGELWSDWSNIGWMIVSSPPTAALVFPDGQSAAAPTIIQGNRRPTIVWNQYDPDLPYGEVFQQYHVRVVTNMGYLVYENYGGQWTQSTSQSMTVTADLQTGVPLAVGVRVFDGYEWSPYSNIGWMLINMPPSADVTYPSGTQASPTIEVPTPTITWNQGDPDPGTIFLKYQVHVVNEANTAVVYDSGEVSQNTSGTTQSHLVGTDLPAGQKLRVRVRVHDGYVWSGWSSDKWLLVNRPPVAGFDWSPKPIWEGDHVYLNDLSTDPDGNALTYSWEIRTPDGIIRAYSTPNVAEHFALPGPYTVTLTVSDGLASSTVTKVLDAAPLTIRSRVDHTPGWLVIHNDKGHNTTTVPKDFYSGETFVVGTTSSPAPVAEATAWIDTIGIDGNRLVASVDLVRSGADATRFEGTLFDDKFMSATEGIPAGALPIHFRILYANGVVRTEDVPVTIIGNANDAYGVHRRQ